MKIQAHCVCNRCYVEYVLHVEGIIQSRQGNPLGKVFFVVNGLCPLEPIEGHQDDFSFWDGISQIHF